MTIQDVNQLLAIMKANYSYAFKAMSPDERYMLLGTWAVTLQDLPADVVMLAVMQLVSQSKWMPTVAEIREKCREIHYAAATPDTTFDMMLANGMRFTLSLSPNRLGYFRRILIAVYCDIGCTGEAILPSKKSRALGE